MSYVLFLGFKSIIYKDPRVIRLYLNDIFLDEFSLISNKPCNENYFSYWSENYLKWVIKNDSNPRTFNEKELLDEPLFHDDIIFHILELDENFIKRNKKHKLTIEYLNTSNNYTNGFITKSTLTSFYMAYLIPKSVVADPNKFCNSFIDKQKSYRYKQNKLKIILNDYKTKHELFNLYKYNDIKDGSGILKIKWYNYQDKNSLPLAYSVWQGDKGHFNLNFDTDIIDNNFNNVDQYTVKHQEVKALSNKYKQYAN